jgi:hypothetical protein
LLNAIESKGAIKELKVQQNSRDRLQVIHELLEQRISPSDAGSLLGAHPWDYEGIPAVLLRRHVSSVLERYLSGEISQAVVVEWADVIELRDDIEPEKGFENSILEIIFELANPILNGKLNSERAHEILLLLNSDSFIP